jgi:hypothetical protein
LMVLAHLRKGETYRDLAAGFGVGVTTAYRYLREGMQVLAALAPSLQQAMQVPARKAYVVLDGTLLRIDRVAMASRAGLPRGSARTWVIRSPEASGVAMSPACPTSGLGREGPPTLSAADTRAAFAEHAGARSR